ncbi:MAG: thioredoxin [Pirellulales bacterium]|nr:thioredoxin [Pirellulales bacterium]
MLTDANFQTEVLDSDQPVLVDFYATWCGPCQTMAPVVADVAGDYEGRAVVGQLDVDQNPSIADRYGIASIPTFLVFKDGQVVDRIVGSTSKSGLTGMLDAAMTP